MNSFLIRKGEKMLEVKRSIGGIYWNLFQNMDMLGKMVDFNF
jgi:hypothetical protein